MRMHDQAVRLLGWLRLMWEHIDFHSYRLYSGWYFRRAWRWVRGRYWGLVLETMDRPDLCRRLPAWLLRFVVRAHLMIPESCKDAVAKREGTLARPHARQRVRGWTSSREKVLNELDRWTEVMVKVRTDMAAGRDPLASD